MQKMTGFPNFSSLFLLPASVMLSACGKFTLNLLFCLFPALRRRSTWHLTTESVRNVNFKSDYVTLRGGENYPFD